MPYVTWSELVQFVIMIVAIAALFGTLLIGAGQVLIAILTYLDNHKKR